MFYQPAFSAGSPKLYSNNSPQFWMIKIPYLKESVVFGENLSFKMVDLQIFQGFSVGNLAKFMKEIC